MTTAESIIIGIVEGITEFLPISSTAHMRITENILGILALAKAFELISGRWCERHHSYCLQNR